MANGTIADAPDAAAAASPTVTEFLDAAVENYSQSGQAGDLTPFLVNGQQMQVINYTKGLVATVWLTPARQVVISYEGTFGNTPGGWSPAELASQVADDLGIFYSTSPVPGETAGLAFARQVALAAASQGISANNIFVTGHSLGATIASYVAEQTGFGGIAFEPIGIGPAVGTKGAGSNFVAVDTYGDAIPAYASNETAIGPVAPTRQPLYGQVLHVGDPNWQTPLTVEAWTYGPAIFLGGKPAQVTAEISLFTANLLDHLPLTQAHALGVTLPPPTNPAGFGIDTIGNTGGPVLNVGSDTLSQLIAYIKATNGNTNASTPMAGTTPPPVGQRFVEAMATLAPRPAAVWAAETGATASHAAPGLIANGAQSWREARAVA